MSDYWLFVALALVVGAALPLQAGINAELRTHVGHPAWAALASFTVGTLALLAYFLAAGHAWPSAEALRGVPWWLWTGGLIGAAFVTVALMAAPRLGAATLVALAVAGQMLASLALDHYGVLGYPHHAIHPIRVAGAGLLLVGVVLVRAF